jgi:DNA-binding NarL/FixJ family response regulator
MNAQTKIFIAEQDCESLVSTMLWLEQYPDFEVYGTASAGSTLTEQIEEIQPDVVMLGANISSPQGALSLKRVRSTTGSPAVMLFSKSEITNELLAAECDGQIGPRTGLNEMPDLIRKAINRRLLSSISSSSMPMAMAG